jgi:hypothetical protein
MDDVFMIFFRHLFLLENIEDAGGIRGCLRLKNEVNHGALLLGKPLVNFTAAITEGKIDQ